MNKKLFGFTLIEVLVVISIISVLSAVVYANFGEAQKSSRDKVRKTSLKELALALEVYKSQNGVYPAKGCGSSAQWAGPGPLSSWGASCSEYINGLVPDFKPELPTDPNQESVSGLGFIYRVSPEGDRYKAMVHQSVENDFVSGFENEFARCPSAIPDSPCEQGPPQTTYAVYSRGAESW